MKVNNQRVNTITMNHRGLNITYRQISSEAYKAEKKEATIDFDDLMEVEALINTLSAFRDHCIATVGIWRRKNEREK